MEILEFGDRNKRKIIFIHGFHVLIKYGKNISKATPHNAKHAKNVIYYPHG